MLNIRYAKNTYGPKSQNTHVQLMCSLFTTRHASMCLVCSALCYCSLRWREFLNSARSKQYHYRLAAVLQNTIYNPRFPVMAKGRMRTIGAMSPATSRVGYQPTTAML